MRMLINNLIEQAIDNDLYAIAGGDTRFPIANLTDNTPVTITEFTFITFDVGAGNTINSLGVLNADKSITIESSPDPTFLSPTFRGLFDGSAPVIFLPSPTTHRYWKIKPTAGGSARVGYFYAGGYLQLPPTTGSHIPKPLTTDNKSISSGGQVYPSNGILYREEFYSFPMVYRSEKEGFEDWYDSTDRSKNHLIIPLEEGMDILPPYFGSVMEYDPNRDLRNYLYSIKIREAK